MEEESDRVNYNTIERQVQQRYNDEKESINWKRFGVWTYVFVTLLAIIVFTNFLYKESLFELSNKFTKSIQDIFASFLPYSDTLFITMVLLSSEYLEGVLKLLLHDPRPFYVDGNVKAIDCAGSFGNPSGHSIRITTILPCLIVCCIEMARRSNQIPVIANFFFIVEIVLAILISSFMLFGRIYLGSHSIQQHKNMFGSISSSAWLPTWYNHMSLLFIFRKETIRCIFKTAYFASLSKYRVAYSQIKELTQYFIYISFSGIGFNQFYRQFLNERASKQKALIHGIIICCIAFILILISVGVYDINIRIFDIPQLWINSMVFKCNYSESGIRGKYSPSNSCMLNMISSTGLLGGVLGIVIYSCLSSNPVDKLSFLPFKQTESKTCARLVLNFVSCLPSIILFFMAGSASYGSSVAMNFFCMFLGSFMIFGVNRLIFCKLGLITESEQIDIELANSNEEQKEEEQIIYKER